MDDAWEWNCLSSSPEETFAIGRALGAALAPDATAGPAAEAARGCLALALIGDLGSGKTLFTKGLAAGAGVREADRVTSPTFVLRQDYLGRRPIHHYDVYRLHAARDLLDLGFTEDLDSGALVVVEWADRVAAAIPAEALFISFEHAPAPPGIPGTSLPGAVPSDPGRRRLTFRGIPGRWAALVRRAVGNPPAGLK
jgi:tRNA threonylcarbamoyladenosine biosynthesis protein TsaE